MKSKAKTWYRLSVSALFIVLYSCMADTQHIAFTSIEHDGWAETDTLTYTIAPLNGITQSTLSLLLHTESYNYENIALGITVSQDTTLLYHEQRNYLLSHNRPRDGIGRRCDYTLPVGNISFCDTLPIFVTLTQRTDQPILTGIREVGIHFGFPLRQSGEPEWRVDWH